MGFDFGSFLGGFAERSMEISDAAQERQDRMAEATAKYRLESAVSAKKEMDTLLKSKVLTANKLRKYGYTNAQLLALANNGRLEDVLGYMEKADLDKDVTIDTKAVVSQANMIPEGGDFDSLFKDAVFGVPDKFEEKDLFGTKKSPDNKGLKGVLFGPRTSGRETEEQYYKSAGFTPEEVARYSSDGFTRVADDSVIDMSPFAALTEKKDDKDYRTSVQAFLKNQGASAIGDILKLETSINQYTGETMLVPAKDARDNARRAVENAMSVRMDQLLRDGETWAQASNIVSQEFENAVGDARGEKAVPAAFAWANSITGGKLTAPAPATTETPSPDVASSIDWSNPNAKIDVMAGMTEDQAAKFEKLWEVDQEQAKRFAERVGVSITKASPQPAPAVQDTATTPLSTDTNTALEQQYGADLSDINLSPIDPTMLEGVKKAMENSGIPADVVEEELASVTTEEELKQVTIRLLKLKKKLAGE
jgi:hypothetical protein